MRSSYIALASLVIAASFSSCKKVVHQNIQAANNTSVSLTAFDDVLKQVGHAADNGVALDMVQDTLWPLYTSACAMVSLAPLGSAYPKTLTIDYGNGCVGLDGQWRSGTIVAVFSGDYRAEGTEITIELTDYTVDQYSPTGMMTVNNNGTQDTTMTFSVSVTEGHVEWDGKAVKWNAELTRVWSGGVATGFYTDNGSGDSLGVDGLNDDLYLITGTISGNDRIEHPYSAEILTALQLQTGCAYVEMGELSIHPTNYNEGVIDFGDGSCNQQATIEIDGQVYNFTM